MCQHRSLSLESLESRIALASDTPFQPVLDLQSSEGVVSNRTTGFVSQWRDDSHRNNHLFAEPGERPTLLINATPSSASALQFDGVDDRLLRDLADGSLASLPDRNEARSMFLVARFHDATAWAGAAYGRSGSNKAFGLVSAADGPADGQVVLQGWGRRQDLVTGSQAFEPGEETTDGWMLLSVVHTNSNPGDSTLVYRDGARIASWNHRYDTRIDSTTLLRGSSRSRLVIGEEIGELGHVQMDVAAWIVYDIPLRAAQRRVVEDYLTQKYLDGGGRSNLPPTAIDDTATITKGQTAHLHVTSNDTDPDGDINMRSVQIVSAPRRGTATVDAATGVVTYSHNGTAATQDRFTYRVADEHAAVSKVATVQITIAPVSLPPVTLPPVATTDRVTLNDGGTLIIDVLANDYGGAGTIDPATVVVLDAPTAGSIERINFRTGQITYKHTRRAGPDSFTYVVYDRLGAVSNVATVFVAMQSGPLPLTGFADENVLVGANVGLQQPIALEFLPDGRMLILQKDGEIFIADPNSRAVHPYLTLTNIDTAGEKGLLDIAVSPDFDPMAPGKNTIFLYYTPASPGRARIARFTHQENGGGLTSTARRNSEVTLWQDTTGYISCCHFGGGLDFGPDGKLWLTLSDKFTAPNPGEGGTNENHPQDRTIPGGGIVRVNVDGTVPDGSDGWPANPYIDPVDDDQELPGRQDYHDYLWAYGLRNPFRSSWDIPSRRFFVAEVGGNRQSFSHEDLHVTTLAGAGTNFGWPNHEGPGLLAHGEPIQHATPIFSYPHAGVGASITGGEVYRGSQFPAAWDGVYFYGDFTRDSISYLTFDTAGNVSGTHEFKPTSQIPGRANQVVYLGVGPDGALYYVLIGGRIRRVTHAAGNQAPTLANTNANVQAGVNPLRVRFRANVSDTDSARLTYTWHFGDGTSRSGRVTDGKANANFTYASQGVFQAYLSVTDGSTVVHSQVLDIKVGPLNEPPQIESFTSPERSGDSPLTTTFEAHVTDPEKDALTYQIEFGDGRTTNIRAVPASGQVRALHTYRDEGNYQARLVVFDATATTTSLPLAISVGQIQLPPVTAGLVALLESDIKLSIAQGDIVAAWLDGSGQGNNLDAWGDPRFVASATPSGLPAIVLDGDGDKLQRLATTELNELPSGNDDRTVLTVVRYDTPLGVDAGFAYGGARSNAVFGLVANGAGGSPRGVLALQGYGEINDFNSNVSGRGADWLVQSAVVRADNVSHYKDGALIDSFKHVYATDTTSNQSKIVIGEEIGGAGYSKMAISAVLVYDRALSETQRQQVEEYLLAKYLSDSGDDNG